MELTKTIWSHSQLSYKARKKHCRVSYLKGKANRKEHMEDSSRTYHLIMSTFSLFHFVALMKILASISW